MGEDRNDRLAGFVGRIVRVASLEVFPARCYFQIARYVQKSPISSTRERT